jgi:hypothetical protein
VNIFVTHAVMLIVVLVNVHAIALDPLALYEDFSGTNLNPDKCVESESAERRRRQAPNPAVQPGPAQRRLLRHHIQQRRQ